MFDKHDEKAREIVHEFNERYNLQLLEDPYNIISPRVFLLTEIAKALKEAAKNNEK